MVDVVVEKQVSALKESFIKFFRRGIIPCHGIGSFGARITLVCQICSPCDNVVTIYPIIGYLKSKCGKCDLPHNCDLKYDYYNGMGHTKEELVLEKKEGTQTKLCCK